MSLQTLQTVGAILGIVAFGWKVWDLFQSYLRVTLSVETDDAGNVTAKVGVENRSLLAKNVDNALLLVCPEHEDPAKVYNAILAEIGSSDAIRSLRGVAVNVISSQIYSKDRTALIPLPFFYSEQESLGDEIRTYRASIDSRKLFENARYSVYFLVWGTGRLHRMTHDSFISGQKRTAC
jgi:hypothetical protein